MHEQAYPLITCLAVFKSPQWPYVGGVVHHCRRELPHTTHRCACGIQWPDAAGERD